MGFELFVEEFVLAEQVGDDGAPGAERVVGVVDALILALVAAGIDVERFEALRAPWRRG